MGFINSLLIGAGEAGKAAQPLVRDYLKDTRENEAQILRDETLRRYRNEDTIAAEERAIANIPRKQAAETPGLLERKRREGDIEVDVANRKPQHVPEGQTLLREGQEPFTAPKTATPKTPEELAEIGARTELLRAQEAYWKGAKTDLAEARAERVAGGKEQKPIFPKMIKGDAEGSFWIDQNTNAVGTVIPATPDKSGEKNWIFPDKPEVKGKPAHMVWNFLGRTMSDTEYNRIVYGGVNPISGRGVESEMPWKVYPVDIEAAQKDPEAYRKLADIVGGTNTLDNIISDYTRNPDKPASKGKGIVNSRAALQPEADPRAPYYRPEMEAQNPHLTSLRLRAAAGDTRAWTDYMEQTGQAARAKPLQLR